MNDELPIGRTCADCVHHARCVDLFQCPADNTTCDWIPSRFALRPADQERYQPIGFVVVTEEQHQLEVEQARQAGHAAGAADMRERAALQAEWWLHHDTETKLGSSIRALPLTAPSAGAPVDETKVVVADCCTKCGGRKWIKWTELDSYHACRCPPGAADDTGRKERG